VFLLHLTTEPALFEQATCPEVTVIVDVEAYSILALPLYSIKSLSNAALFAVIDASKSDRLVAPVGFAFVHWSLEYTEKHQTKTHK